MCSMAIFMMSAAVPWMGALMASRSSRFRTVTLALALQRGEVAPAPQQRLHVAILRGGLADAIQVFLDARELREVGLDEVLGLGQRQIGRRASAQRLTCRRSGRS